MLSRYSQHCHCNFPCMRLVIPMPKLTSAAEGRVLNVALPSWLPHRTLLQDLPPVSQKVHCLALKNLTPFNTAFTRGDFHYQNSTVVRVADDCKDRQTGVHCAGNGHCQNSRPGGWHCWEDK